LFVVHAEALTGLGAGLTPRASVQPSRSAVASPPLWSAASLPRGRRSRPAVCGIEELPDDCYIDQVVAAAAVIGRPTGDVQEQQAAVIAYLIRRLQLEDEVVEREKEWMYAIQVAGDLGRAGELLEEKDALQEQLDTYAARETEVALAVSSRDGLSARVDAGRGRAAEAELELAELTMACAKLDTEMADFEADKVRLEATRAECKQRLRSLPETVSALKTKLRFLTDETSRLLSEVASRSQEAEEATRQVAALEPEAEALAKEAAEAAAVVEASLAAAIELMSRIASLQKANAASSISLASAAKEEEVLRVAAAEATETAEALPVRIASTAALTAKWLRRLETLNAATIPLEAELESSSLELVAARKSYTRMGLRSRAAKENLERLGRDRERLEHDAATTRERTAVSDAAARSVSAEVAALGAEAPVLFSALQAAERRVETALVDAAAFSAGPAGAMINLTLSKLPKVKGAELDRKVTEEARLLALSAEQAGGWGDAIGGYHAAVLAAVEAAAAQREAAQEALETMAAEQRRMAADAKVRLCLCHIIIVPYRVPYMSPTCPLSL